MKLTEEQRQKYVERDGTHCPFCNHGNIVAGSSEFAGPNVFQNVVCLECKAEWTDEFRLVNVTHFDE